MSTDVFTLHRGTTPLLVSLPHDGSLIPSAIAELMTASARRAPDTDWHVARLYAFARELGASLLAPRFSRYVVDLNRPPDDVSLYPGQNTTGLCPIVQFSGEPVYRDAMLPTPVEIAERVDRYWRPYHAGLREELLRLKATHGRALLWEGHSIRGEVPFLFDGRLPDLNLGTAGGSSCSPQLQARLEAALAAEKDYDYVINGRFRGGYITRHYGDPANGIDAVQLEVSQRIYMNQADFAYDPIRCRDAQALIARLLRAALSG